MLTSNVIALLPSPFRPFLQKSSCNPYLIILIFSQLFVGDAPMNKKSKTFGSPPLRALLGCPVQKMLIFYSNLFITNPLY